MLEEAKFVTHLNVTDPDTQLPVNISVFKHLNGGMFAVDSSFLGHTDEPVYSPFDGEQLQGEHFATEEDSHDE
jgi:hypothetical protein